MKNQDFCVDIYSSLLKLAEKSDQKKLKEYIGSTSLEISQLTKVIELAMEDSQCTIPFIKFKYCDKNTKDTIECNLTSSEELHHWWDQHSIPVSLPLSIYDSSCSNWFTTDKAGFFDCVSNLFVKKQNNLLSSRIVVIKSLITLLDFKVNYSFYHSSTINSFLHRLQYKPLLARQKRKALIWAAKAEATDLVEWLCQRGVDAKAKKIALEIALTQKKASLVGYLYTQQAIMDDEYWDNFIHNVIQTGTIDIIKSLFEKKSMEYNSIHRLKQMTLYAMKANQDEILELCLEHLVDKIKSDQSVYHSSLERVLLYAAELGYTMVLRRLVGVGMSCNCYDQDHNTPLLIAVRYGKLGTVNFLLKRGANINAANKEDMTPIKAALFYHQFNIFRSLLAHIPILDVSTLLEHAHALNREPNQVGQYQGFITLLEQLKESIEVSMVPKAQRLT